MSSTLWLALYRVAVASRASVSFGAGGALCSGLPLGACRALFALCSLVAFFTFQRRQLRHRMDGIHRRPPGKRCLRGVLRRDKQRLNPLPFGGKRHGQHAGNGTDGAVQTQLPKESAGGFRPPDASAGRENTQ